MRRRPWKPSSLTLARSNCSMRFQESVRAMTSKPTSSAEPRARSWPSGSRGLCSSLSLPSGEGTSHTVIHDDKGNRLGSIHRLARRRRGQTPPGCHTISPRQQEGSGEAGMSCWKGWQPHPCYLPRPRCHGSWGVSSRRTDCHAKGWWVPKTNDAGTRLLRLEHDDFVGEIRSRTRASINDPKTPPS